ncbi:hypothetical protein [Providencia sp.]|uniref:hypothetical protein n=1 Tax=Providencia sp. TaxID=589 RepID=UPI00334251EA
MQYAFPATLLAKVSKISRLFIIVIDILCGSVSVSFGSSSFFRLLPEVKSQPSASTAIPNLLLRILQIDFLSFLLRKLDPIIPGKKMTGTTLVAGT